MAYPEDYHAFRCYHCNYIIKFDKQRTDVSTYCDKCHVDMDPCLMRETNLDYTAYSSSG